MQSDHSESQPSQVGNKEGQGNLNQEGQGNLNKVDKSKSPTFWRNFINAVTSLALLLGANQPLNARASSVVDEDGRRTSETHDYFDGEAEFIAEEPLHQKGDMYTYEYGKASDNNYFRVEIHKDKNGCDRYLPTDPKWSRGSNGEPTDIFRVYYRDPTTNEMVIVENGIGVGALLSVPGAEIINLPTPYKGKSSEPDYSAADNQLSSTVANVVVYPTPDGHYRIVGASFPYNGHGAAPTTDIFRNFTVVMPKGNEPYHFQATNKPGAGN